MVAFDNTTHITAGDKMRNKSLMLCGILAPIVYALTVVLGGILRPGYSHVAQAVSDLIATGAPNKALLDPLFAVYNLLVIAFAIGLFQHVHADHQKYKKISGTVGALVLVAQGIFGLATLIFPEPAGGMSAAITSTGAMHIVFAGLSSLTTMLTILLMGFWFRNSQYAHRYGLYSFISVAAVFLSGGLAAITVANQSPVAGLVERITIGGFLQWLLVIALNLYSSEKTNILSVEYGGAK
jgi:hypothetical membrane protein